MKTKLFYILTLALLPFAAMANDVNFQKKAAETVWSTRPNLFDPHREIPDSLKDSYSAVIIGQYDYVYADYHTSKNSFTTTTSAQRVIFTRKMVKLLDQKAVEDFSKHEFGEKREVGLTKFKRIAEVKNTFGAKIHKPDGSVQEVDLGNAFDVTEGKKDNKVVKKKIDISGLQPGDVLEYFTYIQDSAEELDLPEVRILIADRYPVLESVVEGIFHPKLTVEFRGYNGAPEMECGVNDKGQNTAWLHLINTPAMTDRHFVNRIREVPFYDFYILNNTSVYRRYPKYKRGGGLYQNLLVGQIFRDISHMIAESDYGSTPFPGKVRKLLKNYRSQHPDASTDHLIDVAWSAANYINSTDKDANVSDYWLAIMMCDVLKKEKLSDDAGVAFINPANGVPTSEIVSWRQPDFGMYVGDRLYTSSSLTSFLPGELPPLYQGQMCGSYPGDKKKLMETTMPAIVTTPVSKPNENRFIISSTVTLGEENDASVENDVTLTGAMKHISSMLNTYDDWIAVQEDLLGIPQDKRYRGENVEPEIMNEYISTLVKGIYYDVYAGENATVSDIKISSRGITKEQPDFKMSFVSSVPEVYSSAGDELVVKIGQFTGRQDKIDGVEREQERLSNISFLAASQDNYNVTLNIPEGYCIDEESLSSLSNNIQTSVGLFISTAKKSEDGKSVTLATRYWINTPLVGPDAWPDVLKITDAHAAFNDALIVLKKTDSDIHKLD